METQMTLNESERRLIEWVRTLPEAQAQRVMALFMQLSIDLEKPQAEFREPQEGYRANEETGSASRGVRPEVIDIVQRSLDEHADVWAELAKR